MKLNKEELAHIKEFISRRGFTYYDLQLEIIDHVACKVEELMTADDSLSLDAAINKAHSQFGVMGFSVIEDSMRSSLQKRYWKLYRQLFIEYLKPVYLPLIAGFTYLVYLLSKAINAPVAFFNSTWIIVFMMLFGYAFNSYRDQRKYKHMLTFQLDGVVALALNVPIQLYNVLNIFHKESAQFNAGTVGIVIGLFLAFVAINFLILYEIQKSAIEKCRELEEQYMMTVGG